MAPPGRGSPQEILLLDESPSSQRESPSPGQVGESAGRSLDVGRKLQTSHARKGGKGDPESSSSRSKVPRLSEDEINGKLQESMNVISSTSSVIWNNERVSDEKARLARRRHTASQAELHDAGQGDQVAKALLTSARQRSRKNTFANGSIAILSSLDVHDGGNVQVQSRVGNIGSRRDIKNRRAAQMNDSVMPFVGRAGLANVQKHMKRGVEAAERNQRRSFGDSLSVAKNYATHMFARRSMNRQISGASDRGSMSSAASNQRRSADMSEQSYQSANSHKPHNHGMAPIAENVTDPDFEAMTVPLTFQRFKFPVSIYTGRMSSVFVAIDQVNKQPVVLRRYTKCDLTNDQSVRLGKEIQLMEKLVDAAKHNVVEYLGCFTTDEYIFIVTENCTQGDLLRELTLSHGRSLPEEVLRSKVVPQLLTALVYLHGQKIVHGDIKPENLFQTNSGVIKLGDFHYAVDLSKDTADAREGLVDYMAPEVLVMPTEEERKSGKGKQRLVAYNEKVDIWQVGVLIYELLTGETPFEAEDVNLTAGLILWGEISTYPLYMSEGAVDFIQQCLRKIPSTRPDAKTLLQHHWVRKGLIGTVAGSMNHADSSKQEKRGSILSWLVPGFLEVKYNVAELGVRKDEQATEEHEYISPKDDTFLPRIMRGVTKYFGWNKEPPPEEQIERECFENLGTDIGGSKAVHGVAAVLDRVTSITVDHHSQAVPTNCQ
mmetsp:Transcript_3167/g.8977  ORF Transcript_3167/g.8977 Transcript_3167/m.8977 type:complete len:716 (-) Transcript_3167:235-2382(-)